MRPVNKVKIVFRWKIFYWFRFFLPRKCVLDFRIRGKKVRHSVPINKPFDPGPCREIQPVRLIDAIVFVVVVYRRGKKYKV